jgi:hypothetical protein
MGHEADPGAEAYRPIGLSVAERARALAFAFAWRLVLGVPPSAAAYGGYPDSAVTADPDRAMPRSLPLDDVVSYAAEVSGVRIDMPDRGGLAAALREYEARLSGPGGAFLEQEWGALGWVLGDFREPARPSRNPCTGNSTRPPVRRPLTPGHARAHALQGQARLDELRDAFSRDPLYITTASRGRLLSVSPAAAGTPDFEAVLAACVEECERDGLSLSLSGAEPPRGGPWMYSVAFPRPGDMAAAPPLFLQHIHVGDDDDVPWLSRSRRVWRRIGCGASKPAPGVAVVGDRPGGGVAGGLLYVPRPGRRVPRGLVAWAWSGVLRIRAHPQLPHDQYVLRRVMADGAWRHRAPGAAGDGAPGPSVVLAADSRADVGTALAVACALCNLEDSRWRVIIFTSESAAKFYRAFFAGTRVAREGGLDIEARLPARGFDIECYNRLMKSPDTWRRLASAHRVLTVQSDGTLVRRGLEGSGAYRSLYAGAPWHPSPILPDPPVGNGGLSVRCPRACLSAAEEEELFPSAPFPGAPHMSPPEDVVFSSRIRGRLSYGEARATFMEQLWCDAPLGHHKFWAYHPADRVAHYFSRLSDATLTSAASRPRSCRSTRSTE